MVEGLEQPLIRYSLSMPTQRQNDQASLSGLEWRDHAATCKGCWTSGMAIHDGKCYNTEKPYLNPNEIMRDLDLVLAALTWLVQKQGQNLLRWANRSREASCRRGTGTRILESGSLIGLACGVNCSCQLKEVVSRLSPMHRDAIERRSLSRSWSIARHAAGKAHVECCTNFVNIVSKRTCYFARDQDEA